MDVTPDSRSTRRDDSTPLTKLNEFLSSRDVSPVRHTVTVPWDEASERTRRRHLRKTQQAVSAVLEEVAPKQFIGSCTETTRSCGILLFHL